MKSTGRFAPNIGTKGRVIRGLAATTLLIGGIVSITHLVWLGMILLFSGAFVLFEATRGWCALRVCSIKTKF